jgi:4-aminobutyrate aminotransferase-like enzyme
LSAVAGSDSNKQILALNAFDQRHAAQLAPALAERVRRRARLFGSASVLFYDTPLEIVRGEGCWLYDANGTAYLDAYNNVPSVGHCHPHVVAAVSKQLATLNVHSRYLHPLVMDYAERLLATLPPALSNVTFTCTGSESNDLALRLAARFTGASGILVTETAYHGNTELSGEASPSSFAPAAITARVRLVSAPDSYRVPAAKLAEHFAAQVSEAIEDLRRRGLGVAALLIDSIFSSDGVYADPPGFLKAAVDAVHRAGGLVIADEVQCGFGRTGAALWGFDRHGFEPDIVTMGKPMGNGYPMGAVVTRPEILDALREREGYFNTFGGTAAAAAAGNAVLDVIEQEDLLGNALQVGEHLRRSARALAAVHPCIGDVRGAGLFIGIELIEAGDPSRPLTTTQAVINAMRERGVLIGAAGRWGNVLKVRPPLCFSRANADQLVAALDEALRATAAAA